MYARRGDEEGASRDCKRGRPHEINISGALRTGKRDSELASLSERSWDRIEVGFFGLRIVQKPPSESSVNHYERSWVKRCANQ